MRKSKYATEEDRKAAQYAHHQAYRQRNIEKVREWRRAAHKRHREKYNEFSRQYRLKTAFGITEGQYEQMLISQGGGCAICGGINASGKKLAVDHCHASNRIRGLLCTLCNTLLGHAKDRIETLEKAINYLRTNV